MKSKEVNMKLGFNTNVTFKQQQYPILQGMAVPSYGQYGYVPAQSAQPQAVTPVVIVPQPVQADVVETSKKGKKVKEPKVKKASFIRRAISGVAKFFATLGEMAKATGKAIFYGATSGLGTMVGAWAIGTLPRAIKAGKFAKNGGWQEIFKHPVKNISKTGKIAAGIVAAGVAAIHLVKGWLNSNEKTAKIDHRWKTGHREG